MNFVTIYEEYKHKFFQIPQLFFTNENYKNMSSNAKLAWAILRERASLSRKNNWFDKKTGRIYFIYTNEELMKILNVKSKTTLSNIKRELEEADLIESKRVGLRRPNKLYLKYPILNETDIYKIDNMSESFDSQGSPFYGRPDNGLQDVQKVYTNNTEYNNTELKTLDTLDTEALSKKQNQEQYYEDAFYNNYAKVPQQLSLVFKVFCETTEEAASYYEIINKAKLDVFSNALDVKNVMLHDLINIDNKPDLLQKIVDTFVRVIKKEKKDKSLQKVDGYLYTAVYNEIWSFYFN